MGPRGLNQFFRNKNPEGINEMNIESFSGKTIVVDTSIYLYRFNTNNELIENLYIMICVFKRHNITPLFIFDGKPPPEKFDSLNVRRKEREEAEKLYDMLLEAKNTVNINKSLLEKIKRKKTRVNSQNIQESKMLFEACGISYIEANGEADELCAYCVLKNIAYACLSDDMDLFIYGCPRIMRYFSMMNQTVVYYELDKILTSLEIPLDIFTNIAILSGTDYYDKIMSIDKMYHDYINNNEYFIENVLKKMNEEKYKNIQNYYNIQNRSFNEVLSSRKYFKYCKQTERKFLSNYHFIFIE